MNRREAESVRKVSPIDQRALLGADGQRTVSVFDHVSGSCKDARELESAVSRVKRPPETSVDATRLVATVEYDLEVEGDGAGLGDDAGGVRPLNGNGTAGVGPTIVDVRDVSDKAE
jgi:hypothetical protein